MFIIQKYSRQYNDYLFQFLERCLPQSGRSLDLNGRHKMYYDIDKNFEYFWCLFDGKDMIGTVALKMLNKEHCELKSLYLLEQYHKKGLGYQLLQTAIIKAQQEGYKEMYLDTLSSSKKAICLYEKMGFVRIERYNANYAADVFMVLKLDFEERCLQRSMYRDIEISEKQIENGQVKDARTALAEMKGKYGL